MTCAFNSAGCYVEKGNSGVRMEEGRPGRQSCGKLWLMVQILLVAFL